MPKVSFDPFLGEKDLSSYPPGVWSKDFGLDPPL